jgi:hypothetical protein
MSNSAPSDLVLLLIKIGFLVLLWAFVLFAVRAVRLDIFGPTRGSAPIARPATQRPPAPSARKSRTPSKLVVTKGALAGTTISLGTGDVTIGRAHDSTLVLTDDFASTHHARLVHRDGQWLIEDLGSTNGTYLDRMKVTSPMPVPLGAPVRIGKTVLELRK